MVLTKFSPITKNICVFTTENRWIRQFKITIALYYFKNVMNLYTYAVTKIEGF